MRVGVYIERAGEDLVEIAAGDHIVALLVFALDKIAQLLGLGDLALAVVIGLEMEVHKAELLVGPLDRQPARQQAALEVDRAHRPRKRAGQRDALGTRDVIALRCREDARVDLADRRHRVGYEGNREVQRLDAVVPGEIGPLVHAEAARGVEIDLLQHDEIAGVFAVIDRRTDTAHVLADGELIRRADGLAPVHKEVRRGPEPAVADVPAQHMETLVERQGFPRRVGRDRQLLDRLGPVLRPAEIAEPCADGHDNDN